MLMQLPDGDWIDHAMVMEVRYMDTSDFGPRIIVSSGSGALYCLRFDSADAARDWQRQQFARECNSARQQ